MILTYYKDYLNLYYYYKQRLFPFNIYKKYFIYLTSSLNI